MAKTMGVSPITDRIYYGTAKDNKWIGDKEDVTDTAIKAVFQLLIQKFETECGENEIYQLRFPNTPYVLEMRKEFDQKLED